MLDSPKQIQNEVLQLNEAKIKQMAEQIVKEPPRRSPIKGTKKFINAAKSAKFTVQPKIEGNNVIFENEGDAKSFIGIYTNKAPTKLEMNNRTKKLDNGKIAVDNNNLFLQANARLIKADYPIDLAEKLNEIAISTARLSQEPEETTFETATGTTMISPPPETDNYEEE